MFKKDKKSKPLVDLLTDKRSKPKTHDINKTSKAIKKTFARLGLKAKMGDVYIGPVVTQYTFTPQGKTKVIDFDGVDKDIALDLAVYPVRMEIPVPGTSFGTIEIPNIEIATVTLSELLRNKSFDICSKDLIVPFGMSTLGEVEYVDLACLPHLVIGGATNSGKTCFINSLIISLMCKFTPDEIKFILVDPKRVEMTVYNDIPYLQRPVVTEAKKALDAFERALVEMDRRFNLLADKSKPNITTYNKSVEDKLPYIFIIVDELADLMAVAGAEIEASVIRLAQMGRAVGMHMILASERSSANIFTELMKANIPGRLAFSVISAEDSKVILDMPGAELLLGRGEALFTSAETARPKRLQAPFVSDEEIEKIVEAVKDN